MKTIAIKSKAVVKLALTLSLVFSSLCLNAQEEGIQTLFSGNKDIRVGSYAGIEIKGSQLDGGFNGLFMGGRGGMTLNNVFTIGGAGYGMIPTKKLDCPIVGHENEKNNYLTGGYGGLFLEFISSPNKLVHFTANTLIGAGGITYVRAYESNNVEIDETVKHPASFVFVIEPGIAMEMNLTEFLRMSLGVSYRYSPNFKLQYDNKDILSSTAFNGLSLNLTFKFGNFSGNLSRKLQQ